MSTKVGFHLCMYASTYVATQQKHLSVNGSKAVVGGPADPAMAGLIFGNGIKLTSSIQSINF